MMVLIDKSAIYTVLEAVKSPTGEVTIEEKVAPEVVAMDDIEADAAAQKKKSGKKSASARQDFQEEETAENVGDSLEKTDNNTLLKD